MKVLAVNWSYLIGQFQKAITAVLQLRSSLMLVPTRQLFHWYKPRGRFRKLRLIQLLTASEIDRGLGKSLTYRAPGA